MTRVARTSPRHNSLSPIPPYIPSHTHSIHLTRTTFITSAASTSTAHTYHITSHHSSNHDVSFQSFIHSPIHIISCHIMSLLTHPSLVHSPHSPTHGRNNSIYKISFQKIKIDGRIVVYSVNKSMALISDFLIERDRAALGAFLKKLL